MSLLRLFLIFVKIGAILLGGGYVILPILQNEFTDKRNLITYDELTEYYALSQSLPGIVAANISMFIGYKLRGKCGAVLSMLGIVFIPIITIIFLASFLSLFTESGTVKNIFECISVAVTVLILLSAREVWQNSHRDWFYYLILIFSLCLILIFKFSPIHVILLAAFIGLMMKSLQRSGGKQ